MPIKESSFRIGCGRYVQGENLLNDCGSEFIRLGKRPLIVGDSVSLEITESALRTSATRSGLDCEFVVHDGTCNDDSAKKIAEIKKQRGCDLIVGVGGGVIMDFAKLCAYFAECPVINIPTSSATCAAYTPLSVRYTPEGKTVGTLHYGYEVDAVIVDTSILKNQPVRLLLAGVFDALAKFVEIKQRFRTDAAPGEFPVGLDYAYVMSEYSYRILTEHTAGSIEDMKLARVSERLEQVIFTSIAATGVISGIARGSNQCALGHKFYETTRTLFPEDARNMLHGEIVGVGLLLQNMFNGEKQNNASLLSLMRKHGMPSSVSELNVPQTAQTMALYEEKLRNSSAVEKGNEQEYARLHECLVALWEGNLL